MEAEWISSCSCSLSLAGELRTRYHQKIITQDIPCLPHECGVLVKFEMFLDEPEEIWHERFLCLQ